MPGIGYTLLPKEHATLGDCQNRRLGIGWELDGQGAEEERWTSAHGWYHVD